jgi:type II secretory pathway pseudopilin PulG
VVAIIGVLVAISIPIFTAQLKKARLATNKANARSALSAAMAEFIDTPEDAKVDTIKNTSKHMYFRYDTTTGKCTYLRVDTTSPNRIDGFTYKSFANIGYQPGVNGRGISDVSKWNMDTSSKLSDGTMSSTVLTDRIYRYWDVAMQGDGTFLAIVCLW